MQELLAVVVFFAAYGFIAAEKINRVAVALTGAAAMVLIGATDADHIFYDHERGVDWNVIFLLFGMMIIVGFIHKTGFFEYLAVRAIKLSRGRPKSSLALLMVLTGVASAILDNVTTILLVVPMTLVITRHLNVSPVPFLLAEVFSSNIGGAATLVGDPPNIIIASRAGLSFNDFLWHLLPISGVLVLLSIPMLQYLFRAQLVNSAADRASIMQLDERSYITDRSLLIKSGVVLGLVVVGFVTHSITHLEPSIIALFGAGVLAAIGGAKPAEYLKDIEWETLLFVTGLFIMVGALVNVGALGRLAEYLGANLGDDQGIAAVVILVISALLSGVIDNIPYVVSMSPVIADLAGSFGEGHHDVLWWALAMGADFGGNATIIGASANVVAMGLAARSGHHVSFWQFARYGVPVTLMTIVVSVGYTLLRYA